MIPLPILDALLVTLAALFVLTGAAILVDRLRHDRRARRASDLRDRLASVPPDAIGADAQLRPVLDHLSPAQFHQMTLDGLPEATATSVARELRDRRGEARLRQEAGESAGSDVWPRLVSLHLLAASGPGPAVYPALDEALRSGDRMLAGAAMRLLIRLNDWQAADVLVRALADGACPSARLAAALERLTVPYASLLQPLLHYRHPPVRAWAARLAGRQRMQVLAPAIRLLITDRDAVVRRAAVEALGRVGNTGDRALVLSRFADPVPMVRAHAARAAAAFASETTATALAALLADRAWIVRVAARDTLQRAGAVARPALIHTLWHADRFAANNAAEALYRTGVITEIAERLLQHRQPDPDDAELLARFGETSGPHLRQALLAQYSAAQAARLEMHLVPQAVSVRGSCRGLVRGR